MDLQQALNQPSAHIVLPQGVYQGPAVIQHPCTVDGNHATIWAENGPVIRIDAPNVTLRRLRVCLTGKRGVCIRASRANAALEDVELNGALEGFPEEMSQWILPSFVNVGVFAAGPKPNRVAFPLNAPAPLSLSHNLRGVELSETALVPGLNKVVLTIRNIEDLRTLYGPILAARPGGVVRKIYISGQARANAAPLALPPDYLGSRAATRGERWDAFSHVLRIRLNPCAPAEWGMETFAFLLNENGRTERDEDLIFFNNPGASGIRLNASGEVFLNLDALNPAVRRVTIAFSIYSQQTERIFSQMRGVSLLIEGANPGDFSCVLPLDGLKAVKTFVALDIYRRANTGEWRIFFRKEECPEPDGLQKLCEHYGLAVQ